MVSPGSDVFLRIPDGMQEGRLYRGRVSESNRGLCILVVADPALTPGAGQQVLVHYEQANEFVSRAAVVEAITDTVLELRLVGEAVSAERRREPRVSYLQVLRRVVEDGWHGRASGSELARGATSEDTGDVATAPSTVPPTTSSPDYP